MVYCQIFFITELYTEMSITFEPDAVTIDSEDGDSDIYDEAQVIQWHTSLNLLHVLKRTMTTVIFRH